MRRLRSLIIWAVGSLLLITACDSDVDTIENNNLSYRSQMYGTVQIDFPITDKNLLARCIKRRDLSIAFTADSLYRKEYLTVVNVSSYQYLYEISLKPGAYYYQAGKTCICGGDTCLWGGYPGGQNGTIWTMAKFQIIKGEVTRDLVTFD